MWLSLCVTAVFALVFVMDKGKICVLLHKIHSFTHLYYGKRGRQAVLESDWLGTSQKHLAHFPLSQINLNPKHQFNLFPFCARAKLTV